MKYFIAIVCLSFIVSSHGYLYRQWTPEQETEILAYAEQFCGKIEIDDVNNIMKGVDDFKQCVLQFPFNEFAPIIQKSVEDENFNKTAEVMKDVCSATSIILNCVNDLKSVLPVCFNAQAMNQVEMVMRIIHRILDYVCYNDGERVITILKSDAVKCFTDYGDDLTECQNKYFVSYNQHLRQTLENNAFKVELTKYECDTFDDYHHCLNQLACEKKEIPETISGLFVAVKEETNCNKLQNLV